jgi:hypothetical protein
MICSSIDTMSDLQCFENPCWLYLSNNHWIKNVQSCTRHQCITVLNKIQHNICVDYDHIYLIRSLVNFFSDFCLYLASFSTGNLHIILNAMQVRYDRAVPRSALLAFICDINYTHDVMVLLCRPPIEFPDVSMVDSCNMSFNYSVGFASQLLSSSDIVNV